jgi:hypothetical protein
VTDSSRWDRPAASTTPTRGSRDSGGSDHIRPWGNAVNGSGGRCRASAMRRVLEEQPGECRGNSARIAGDARPGKTSPKRLNSRGRRAAAGRPRSRGSSDGLGYRTSRSLGGYGGRAWPGGCQPALAVPARQNRGGPRQARNLPCDGQRPTAKSAANGADRWVGSDEDESWPAGTGTADAAGRSRRGRWPILARAPGEDGLNSREGQPPRAPSGWPAGEPACSRPIGPLGVISAPRNSHGLPESRSREFSFYDPKAAEPHRRNSGWRHPPPSGSPSGPVGPSGRNSNPDFPVQPRRPLGAKRNLEASRGRVKATFPLATRVCPARSR